MNKKALVILTLVLVVCVAGLVILTKYISKPADVQKPKAGLVVIFPIENQEIVSPLKVTGYVNGDGWVGFEGQVGTVRLVVEAVTLAQAPLTAKGDWMTSSPINFEASLEFQAIGDKNGWLVFANENPSGLPENDREFTLPVRIVGFKGETSTVKLYFVKNIDSTVDCKPTFFTERIIPKTQAIAMATLEELLKGPNNLERSNGFDTVINSGVKIQSLTIDDKGVAHVDFSQELESTGGSCRVTAIRAEITQTLKQFSTVKSVIISIDGRTEDILQP